MNVLSESPVPENGTPGSMRGAWKRNYGQASRAPPIESGGNGDAATYGNRATSLLHSFGLILASARHLSALESTS
jgi:hypothetical protein